MSGATAKVRPRGSAALSIIPVFVLVLAVIGSMAFVAQRIAARQEVTELDREKRLLGQMIAHDSDQLLQQIARDDAVGELFNAQQATDRAEKILTTLLQRHGGDYAALLARHSGRILAQRGEADTLTARADFLARLADASQLRSEEGILLGMGREGRLTHDASSALQLVTLPVGRSLILVVVRPLSLTMLRRLSSALNLPNLRLIAGPAGGSAALKVASLSPAEMHFVWEPRRTTADSLGDLAVYGAIGAVFVALVAAYLFRVIRIETADILQREAKASFEARHDLLSGLPNRAVFCDRVEEGLVNIEEDERHLAVMLLDLDKFKDVNDTYGHAAGDKVIVDFGKRVRALLRQNDTLARLGGDEFAILLPDSRSQKEVGQLAQSIIDATMPPFFKDGDSFRVGVSIGISFAPEDGRDMASVLRAADTALYRAKNEGRNRFAFYEHRMTEAERMRKLVDDELANAIARDELTLVYQPQVDAQTGKLAAVEALVRWNHPTHGNISPALFIPAAEERNLIVALGDWVLRRAARDAGRWGKLRVGINVSAIQFRQRDFVNHVIEITRQAGIRPDHFELELTEGVLVEHADLAEESMMLLREAGFRLALDDFGTGYSSLIYLRRFAFDKIKIDKSFLDSLEETGEGAILVHSVVHLGRALGLEVTAEGVETEEQHRFLKAMGCHYLQGYLFSKPVTADTIDAMLEAEYAQQDVSAA